jgi:hypothetical protein
VNSGLPANARVRVLVHEIAHALGVGYSDFGRQRAEVLVDTVTYIVRGSVGLDVSGSSVPYVTGWGEAGELDAIRTYAEKVDEIARRIEDSITPEGKPRRPKGRLRHDRTLLAPVADIAWPAGLEPASRRSHALPSWS